MKGVLNSSSKDREPSQFVVHWGVIQSPLYKQDFWLQLGKRYKLNNVTITPADIKRKKAPLKINRSGSQETLIISSGVSLL